MFPHFIYDNIKKYLNIEIYITNISTGNIDISEFFIILAT